MPKEVKFVTYTLRYNTCDWLTVEGLGKHWERSRVDGELKDGVITLKDGERDRALVSHFPAGGASSASSGSMTPTSSR